MTERNQHLVERLRSGKIASKGPLGHTLTVRDMTIEEQRATAIEAANEIELFAALEGDGAIILAWIESEEIDHSQSPPIGTPEAHGECWIAGYDACLAAVKAIVAKAPRNG